MNYRHIATGECLKGYLNNYNKIYELEIYDNNICDFRVIAKFNTLKEFLENYEEY